MQIEIRLQDDQLRQFENMIGALGSERARVGMARAINRVTRMAKTRVVRAIVRQTSIPRAIVQRNVIAYMASHQGDGPLQGTIYSAGEPLPLRYFAARQFSFGVRAKVWGETRRFDSHFINAGRWNSGNPVANGHVFKRAGSARLPISRIDGPSVPEGLVAGEAVAAWSQLAQTHLPQRVQHELGRLLGI